eukprot:6525370-Prymnesium_polylepis.2
MCCMHATIHVAPVLCVCLARDGDFRSETSCTGFIGRKNVIATSRSPARLKKRMRNGMSNIYQLETVICGRGSAVSV